MKSFLFIVSVVALLCMPGSVILGFKIAAETGNTPMAFFVGVALLASCAVLGALCVGLLEREYELDSLVRGR